MDITNDLLKLIEHSSIDIEDKRELLKSMSTLTQAQAMSIKETLLVERATFRELFRKDQYFFLEFLKQSERVKREWRALCREGLVHYCINNFV